MCENDASMSNEHRRHQYAASKRKRRAASERLNVSISLSKDAHEELVKNSKERRCSQSDFIDELIQEGSGSATDRTIDELIGDIRHHNAVRRIVDVDTLNRLLEPFAECSSWPI